MKPSDLKALAKEAVSKREGWSCTACGYHWRNFKLNFRKDKKLGRGLTCCVKCGHIMVFDGERMRDLKELRAKLPTYQQRDQLRKEQEKVVKHLIG